MRLVSLINKKKDNKIRTTYDEIMMNPIYDKYKKQLKNCKSRGGRMKKYTNKSQ